MTHRSADSVVGATICRSFLRIGSDGSMDPVDRTIAQEAPVAIEVNGFGYAVLMASPQQLDDLAIGFALTARLIDSIGDVVDTDLHATGGGHILRLQVHARVADRIADRVRHRATDSACGLCGLENLEQAMRPLPRISARWAGEDAAVFRALANLEKMQPLGDATRAVHTAALCGADGTIRLVREDVGRHNAFDKLIGAMIVEKLQWDGGFSLLTSRCSYELVEKAVLAGCPMLATISAPTGLALSRAEEAGLILRTLARPDAMLGLDPAGNLSMQNLSSSVSISRPCTTSQVDESPRHDATHA